jgi:hypothetical protein
MFRLNLLRRGLLYNCGNSIDIAEEEVEDEDPYAGLGYYG